MARYVPDINTKRWVIIAPKRMSRPSEFDKTKSTSEEINKNNCVFCEGNEKMTPPEVFRIGKGEPDSVGWEVRVVPNLYPITDIHEVVIHSKDHEKDMEDLSSEQNFKIFSAFRQRFNFHKKHGQVLIFTNHGQGTGASQIHPHSQIVVVPHQIKLDTLSLEPVANVIDEKQHCVIYCPEFSQWPYEVWIAPKKTGTFFGDINDDELFCLANSVRESLNKIRKTTREFKKTSFDYNMYIYPLSGWYLRIIPRFMTRAGFELGTGIQLNLIDPAEAAEKLTKI